MRKISPVTLIIFITFSGISYAGDALNQSRQQAMQQRAIQERQLQIQTQQAIQQRQAAQQQAQQAMIQQRLLQQRQAESYQQQLIQQQISQRQAAQQQQALQYQYMQKNIQEQQKQALEQAMQGLSTAPNINNAIEPGTEDVVEMSKVWENLESSSSIWPLIIDDASKEIVIAKFIEDYYKQGIYIRKTPYQYIKIINDMMINNPDVLNNRFSQLLQVAAIIEYDFDNGVDKDTMARKILGEENFLINKQRLGM